MNGIKKALLQSLIIGVIGVAVGLTANAVRGSGLQLTRNYFVKARMPAKQATPTDSDAASSSATAGATSEPTKDAGSTTDTQNDAENPAANDSHLIHPYKNVSVDDVVEILNDPNTEFGLNIFVDARNDQAFERGHIPGAIQFDHYYGHQYLDAVMLAAESAEKIVVYCNGGECEDSIFVCGDLVEAGVPFDNIYLFAGGWTDWTAGNHPVATGREE